MLKRIFILLPVFFIIMIVNCDNGVWTDVEYSGEITSSDNSSGSVYYDQYYIYCSGKWTFEITGDDNVYNVWLEGLDDFTGAEVVYDIKSDYGSKAAGTGTLLGTTRINICVMKTNTWFVSNGNKAKYKFKATLK